MKDKREQNRRYEASAAGKAKRRAYRMTEKAKETSRNYDRGPAGRAAYHRHRKNVSDLVNGLKSKPCMDCGGTFDPVCMDFDHRPGEKKYRHISRMIYLSRDMLMAEIAKCDVVCANCHRVRTYRRRTHGDLVVAGREAARNDPQLSLLDAVAGSKKETP